MTPTEYFIKNGYRIYSMIRNLAPLIMGVSVLIGLLLCIVARHNKATRRMGVFGFILGIPLFIIIFVFGVGILNDLLLS